MQFVKYFAILLLLSNSFQVEAQATPKPNIIHIIADDVGYDDLSCFETNGILGIYRNTCLVFMVSMISLEYHIPMIMIRNVWEIQDGDPMV